VTEPWKTVTEPWKTVTEPWKTVTGVVINPIESTRYETVTVCHGLSCHDHPPIKGGVTEDAKSKGGKGSFSTLRQQEFGPFSEVFADQ
jgi:hypothetical protein